jgi:glycosyltransferase involved in cell wall biosynthesis
MSHAVIVSPDPANPAGGVERMCVLLAGVLEQAGWKVTILGPDREPPLLLSRIGAGYLERSRMLTRAARALSPDLLVTNGFLGMGSSRGAPRVHVYHGTMVEGTRAEGPALPRRERAKRTIGAGVAEALSGRGATVVCVSQATAGEVRRYYGVKTDVVIPNGVDTAIFRPRPRSSAREQMGLDEGVRYCLFVGRMARGKGADLLMAACREADFRLLIAGASGAPGAHHLGVLDPESLAVAYAAADCVLFPSRYEACSYVVLEALACGVPLLTTRVGWMSTFLQGVPEYQALCVQPDVQDVIARLRQLPELDTQDLADRGRKWIVSHNSLETYAAHWHDLLVQLGLATSVDPPRATGLAL